MMKTLLTRALPRRSPAISNVFSESHQTTHSSGVPLTPSKRPWEQIETGTMLLPHGRDWIERDVFNRLGLFYNRKRWHEALGCLRPETASRFR